MENYFRQPEHLAHFQEVYIQTLCSPATPGVALPSKNKIIEGFTSFLSQAKTGDTVVFYYTGHGVREQSDIPSFQALEVDGCIGSITAYDIKIPPRAKGGPVPQGEAALSDKEMRYLIRQLAENPDGSPRAHVLTLFDCCHSGHHTRAPEDMPETARLRQVVRQAIPARTHDTFLFNQDEQLWDKINSNAPLSETLPLGNHVMLAACREVEQAWERKLDDGEFGGVFTAALLDVLNAHRNQITYHDLHARILNRMRFFYTKGIDRFDTRQTPQLFIKAPVTTARYHTFLTNASNEQPLTFPLDYMDQEQQWRLAAGAFHRIQPNQQKYPQPVQVQNIHNPTQNWPAHIANVYPTYSLLNWLQDPPPAQGTYLASVEGLIQAPLNICLQGDPDGVDLLQKGLPELADQTHAQHFRLVSSPDQANYVIYSLQGLWVTFLGLDLRPLLMPIQYRKDGKLLPEKALIVYNDLKQMAQWHFLKDLNAQSDTLAEPKSEDYPIELRVFKKVGEEGELRLYPQNGQFLLDLSCDEPVWYLRFELHNHSPEQFHCSLAYLSFNFGMYNQVVMADSTLLISPGDCIRSAPTEESDFIPLKVDPYISEYHWPGEANFLKLTYSRTPLSMDGFEMEGLPTPNSHNYRQGLPMDEMEVHRGRPLPHWAIQTYGFYVVNPQIDFGIAQHLASALPHFNVELNESKLDPSI